MKRDAIATTMKRELPFKITSNKASPKNNKVPTRVYFATLKKAPTATLVSSYAAN